MDGNGIYDSACSCFGTRSTFMHILELHKPFRVDEICLFGDANCMVFNACVQLPKSAKMINSK